jgi:hypothetical protein
LNLLLANPWEHPFAEDLRDYILYLHEISPKLLFLNPLTTHDTGTPAQLYGSGSATVPRYFALALMGTGQTGIVQGTEHEITQKIEFIGRYRTASYGQMNKYTEAIGKINTLHEQHSLFHQGGNIRFIDNRHGAVLACIRDDKFGKERFILVANMDTTGHHQLTLDVSNLAIFGNEVKLEEIFTKEVSVLRDDKLNIFIEPCGIRAYRIS